MINLGSGSDICIYTQNQHVAQIDGSTNRNRSFRRQRLQSTSCYLTKNSSTINCNNNGMTARNAASQLNCAQATPHGINRTQIDLHTPNISKKTDAYLGQPLIRNEIRQTAYRYILKI